MTFPKGAHPPTNEERWPVVLEGLEMWLKNTGENGVFRGRVYPLDIYIEIQQLLIQEPHSQEWLRLWPKSSTTFECILRSHHRELRKQYRVEIHGTKDRGFCYFFPRLKA